MTRRHALLAPAAFATPHATAVPTALALNEDCNHFYGTRLHHRVTAKDLTDWVDPYAGRRCAS